MPRFLLAVVIAACHAAAPTPTPAPAAASNGAITSAARVPFEGTWTGRLELSDEALAIVLTLDDHGGRMSIPAQDAADLSLDNVELRDPKIHFELAIAGVVFDGTRRGDVIEGKARQHGVELAFRLVRDATTKGAVAPLSAVVGTPLVGRWRGVTATGKPRLVELAFAVRDGIVVGTGELAGSCAPAPSLAVITFTPPRAHLELAGGAGALDVVLDDDTLVGQLSVGGDARELRLARVPSQAAAPIPYREIEVGFDSVGGARLAGTLVLPDAIERPPVAVLVTGSGPQDRDECVAGVRPFRQLADHLARRGIATLRYDDRGTARSTGDFAMATPVELAADVAAAIAFLRGRADVDRRKIGVIGHSEGGLIGPMVAARDKHLAFVVLWAGPGLPLPEVGITQVRDLARAEGRPDEEIDAAVRVERVTVAALTAAADEADFAARLRRGAAALTASDRARLGELDAWVIAKVRAMWRPWDRWYRDYDPRHTLRRVTCPVLAINGSRDRQVAAAPNLDAIRRALARNRNVTILELPGLDHVFQPSATGAASAYGTTSHDVDAAVLEATSRWIAAAAK